MRPCLLAGGLLWAMLAASAGGTPQATGLGTLGGRILGPDGKDVEGARVTLQWSDGRHPQTTNTNAQGRFWFPALPSGLYDLRAYSKGRSSEWRHNVWVSPGRQTNVTLRLQPKKPAPSKRPRSPAKSGNSSSPRPGSLRAQGSRGFAPLHSLA
jgi:hypothetical protein